MLTGTHALAGRPAADQAPARLHSDAVATYGRNHPSGLFKDIEVHETSERMVVFDRAASALYVQKFPGNDEIAFETGFQVKAFLLYRGKPFPDCLHRRTGDLQGAAVSLDRSRKYHRQAHENPVRVLTDPLRLSRRTPVTAQQQLFQGDHGRSGVIQIALVQYVVDLIQEFAVTVDDESDHLVSERDGIRLAYHGDSLCGEVLDVDQLQARGRKALGDFGTARIDRDAIFGND